MAHVKGQAGLGAIDQIVSYRLTGDVTADVKPKSPPANGDVAGASAGFGAAAPIGDAQTLDPYSDYYNTYYNTYNTVAQQFFDARTAPLSVLSNIFDEREIPIVLGGYGEMRTAEKLNALPDDYAIFHDIACMRNGRVSANIDHLVIGPNSAIVIDTKVWGTPLQPESHVPFRAYLPHGSSYWNAIDTCLYELQFLPKPPTYLIIAVGGKAGHALASSGPLSITDYVPRFSNGVTDYITSFSANMSRVPCPLPVTIVAQTDIARAVTAHNDTARAYSLIAPPFSMSEIESAINAGQYLRQGG